MGKKFFDSPKIDVFPKTVGQMVIYCGKSLVNSKDAIVTDQAEEGLVNHLFSDPETIKNIEAGGHNI